MVDCVELSQALVRCPSITPLDAGAMDVLIRALEPLGFTCTKLKFDDIENLFARRGNTGPHLCFAGHTDVVPTGPEEAWTHPPFSATISNGKLYGRGTADMKANIAAFIGAITKAGKSDGSISLLITGDEEGPAINGTIRVLEWMKDNNHIPDACIVGEPSNPNQMGDEIKIGRRGSLSGVLTVTGVQGHVAYPHLADNPIPRLARMVDALSSVEWDEGSDHFGPSTLQFSTMDVGNSAANVIPARATAKFNIRFNDLWTPERLEAEIRTTLDHVETGYNLQTTCGAHSFLTTPGPFTSLVRDAVESVTGRIPALTTGGGTSDARFIQKFCPVVECGLVNKTIHKVDEHIDLSDLKQLEEIYAQIIRSFFKK